jgi:hypothetical protein
VWLPGSPGRRRALRRGGRQRRTAPDVASYQLLHCVSRSAWYVDGGIGGHDPPQFAGGLPGRYGPRLPPVCCPRHHLGATIRGTNPDQAFLNDRGDETAVTPEDLAARQPTRPGYRWGLLEVQQPVVGTERFVEPHGVIQAACAQPLVDEVAAVALGVAGDPADCHPLVGQEGRCGLLDARYGASLLLSFAPPRPAPPMQRRRAPVRQLLQHPIRLRKGQRSRPSRDHRPWDGGGPKRRIREHDEVRRRSGRPRTRQGRRCRRNRSDGRGRWASSKSAPG